MALLEANRAEQFLGLCSLLHGQGAGCVFSSNDAFSNNNCFDSQ